jgi:hypothetical protein
MDNRFAKVECNLEELLGFNEWYPLTNAQNSTSQKAFFLWSGASEFE